MTQKWHNIFYEMWQHPRVDFKINISVKFLIFVKFQIKLTFGAI